VYNYQLIFVLSYLALLTNLVGVQKKYDEFDSDIGRLEFVKIKKDSRSLSETFKNSFVIPEQTKKVNPRDQISATSYPTKSVDRELVFPIKENLEDKSSSSNEGIKAEPITIKAVDNNVDSTLSKTYKNSSITRRQNIKAENGDQSSANPQTKSLIRDLLSPSKENSDTKSTPPNDGVIAKPGLIKPIENIIEPALLTPILGSPKETVINGEKYTKIKESTTKGHKEIPPKITTEPEEVPLIPPVSDLSKKSPILGSTKKITLNSAKNSTIRKSTTKGHKEISPKLTTEPEEVSLISPVSDLSPKLPDEQDKNLLIEENKNISEQNVTEVLESDALPFLTSDFFADSLGSISTEQDPMGTQRLLQIKNSKFSPSLLAGTSFKHTSNPDKAENPQRKNSTTLDLSIGVNLGLGEYAVGDYFVCAPAASLMQMRTYNDPLKKFDKDMQVYDADVFIAGLTAPLVLPNDYTLTFSHSYVAPSTFRGERNLISYSNTPTVTLTKNMPFENGNMLILVAGMSYTFSNGDTLEEQIADPVYFNFLKAVMEVGGGSPANDYPANLQDGYSFMVSASYMIPYSERISIVPSISYQSFSFTEGMNDGRVDKTFNLGVSASYLWYEWLSLSLMANYTTKSSNNINTPEFNDLIFGGGINVNHSF
jgi:hypothetical protein